MRVSNNPNSAPVQNASTSATQKAKKSENAQAATEAKKTANAANVEGAKTELSARGKDMSKAKAVASETPDVREEKIAALKKRISEGKYNVDANKIADRLVDDHLKSGIG